jgi:hypothetical protein
MVKAGGGSEVEGGYTGWEMADEMANLTSFPQPEAALVGAQAEQADLPPSGGPEGENGTWSFETSGIYAMETADDLTDAGTTENNAGVAQATHVLAIPQRPRRAMPRNVKRALLVFCVVGVLALLTDGVLLALSVSRHHAAPGVGNSQPDALAQQGTPLTTAGRTSLTPTSTTQAGAASQFALSTSRLAFNVIQGQGTPGSQTVTLATISQGFSWRIDPLNSPAAWLHLPVWQGIVEPGATASFTVNAHPTGLAPGLYTANLLVKAFDGQGNALAGSPAPLGITLAVRPPCVLSVTPAKLSFVAVLVSAPSPQTLTLSLSSGCILPASWQVSSDASWVTFSRSSGVDTGSGSSLIIQASGADKLIGSYTAHITFQGTDGSGAPLVVSSATVTATLTVIA